MELKLTHLMVDDFEGKDPEFLKEIAADSDTIKMAVVSELKRQTEVRMAALSALGVDDQDDAPATPARRAYNKKTKGAGESVATPATATSVFSGSFAGDDADASTHTDA